MQKKKIAAALLLPGLLAGCAVPAFPGTGVSEQATVETAAPPAPQSLTAYADSALAPALTAFAEAEGVNLTLADTPDKATLVLANRLPEGDWLNLNEDSLLAAAAARAGLGTDGAAVTAMPLGKCLYGYWADAEILQALLGEDTAAVSLQNASWSEWSDFAETLTAWLEKPEETTVTLNRTEYTLPAEKTEKIQLDGVFGTPLSRSEGYTAALLAAGETRTEDTLAGPMNAVYSAVALEWDNRATENGMALFTRGKLDEMLATVGSGAAQNLILVPFKCELEDGDLTSEEYNLTGLTNYPVLAEAGWLAIRAGADEAETKTAKSALLWLYSSGEGEGALTETLTLVTPWNTASDKSVLGTMQVTQTAAGILPAVNLTDAEANALTAAEDAQQDSTRNTANRKLYREAACEALGVSTDTENK